MNDDDFFVIQESDCERVMREMNLVFKTSFSRGWEHETRRRRQRRASHKVAFVRFIYRLHFIFYTSSGNSLETPPKHPRSTPCNCHANTPTPSFPRVDYGVNTSHINWLMLSKCNRSGTHQAVSGLDVSIRARGCGCPANQRE